MKFRCYQVLKEPNQIVRIHFDTQAGSHLTLRLSNDGGYKVGEYYEVPMFHEPNLDEAHRLRSEAKRLKIPLDQPVDKSVDNL